MCAGRVGRVAAQTPAGEGLAEAVIRWPKARGHTLQGAVCQVPRPPVLGLSPRARHSFHLGLDLDAQVSAPECPRVLNLLWGTPPFNI